MRVTRASCDHSVRKKCHASHLYPSPLEWTAQGSLVPRERQGKVETCQIIIHGDLALDPLGIEDIQEAGGALPETQLGNTKRFLRLLEEPFLIHENLLLCRFRLSRMLIDGAGQVVSHSNQLRLFFSLSPECRGNVSLLSIP